MKILKLFLTALLICTALGVIGGAVVIRRGFRATAEPSSLEAALATRVRNLAIPANEVTRKSPFEATAEATQQGREFFLKHCAACHGVDGSGRTVIGLSLYPRVPDLRAPATQELADGEIHYIIENGVPQSAPSGNTWKLVFFIRSLRPLSAEEKSQQAATAPFRSLCRLARLPRMSCPDLRALEKDAHGERGA